jgi:peptidoglycan-associated lipoprotein
MKKVILVIALILIAAGCGKKSKVKPSNVTNSSETITINDGDVSKYNNTDDGMDGSSGGFKSIYFEFGRYDITPDMEKRMSGNANIVKSKGQVKLEGNCDEFGTDEFNFALGLKRANAVKQNLVSRGANPSSITLVSLGESKPLCSEPTERCYAKNRRVDFHVMR